VVALLSREPGSVSHSYADCIVDAEAPAEIATLLDQYKAFKT